VEKPCVHLSSLQAEDFVRLEVSRLGTSCDLWELVSDSGLRPRANNQVGSVPVVLGMFFCHGVGRLVHETSQY
jgi:hypothetical protein